MTDWDALFRKRGGWGQWPNVRFVEFAMRTYREQYRARFMELGCGFGAQMRFLADEGFHVYGVDVSPTAIEAATRLLRRHDEDGERWAVRVVDLAGEWQPGDGDYDCIYDVACLQHLLPSQAQATIAKAKRWLKPGGFLWSYWAATGSDDPPSDTPRPHQIGAPDVSRLFGHDGRLTLGSEEVLLGGNRRKHWMIQWQKLNAGLNTGNAAG